MGLTVCPVSPSIVRSGSNCGIYSMQQCLPHMLDRARRPQTGFVPRSPRHPLRGAARFHENRRNEKATESYKRRDRWIQCRSRIVAGLEGGEVYLCGCVHRSTPSEVLRGSLCVHCEDKLSLWGRELEKGGRDSADSQQCGHWVCSEKY